jgi:hypothetical protein
LKLKLWESLKEFGTGFKSHFRAIMLVMGTQKLINPRTVFQLHKIHKKVCVLPKTQGIIKIKDIEL